METPRLHLSEHLSYYLKPEGQFIAVMPDQDPTFSLKFIRDFVGRRIQVACYTREGYALITNVDGKLDDLPLNEAATAILREVVPDAEPIYGRAFLIHPDHFDRRLIAAA